MDDYVIENNTWVHIGLSYYSPDTDKFYLNGQLIHSNRDQRYSSIIADNSRFSISIEGVYLDNSILVKIPDNYEQISCFSRIPIFNYTKMYGEIGSFAFYARTLTDSEFFIHANSSTLTINDIK